MRLSVKVKPRSGDPQIAKQTAFAMIVAATKTAQAAQDDVIDSIGSHFTVRGNWLRKGGKFGIGFKAATKLQPIAEVGTDADWLELHEEGGTKSPRGRTLAIPTKNVRRTKRQLIQKSQRPKAIMARRGFIVRTKSGADVIFQRTGKRGAVKAMYVLVPRAQVVKRETILEPVKKSVENKFGRQFGIALERAFATAKR